MRRFAAWLLLILAAFLVLTGVIDVAVGPELAEQDGGVAASEGASRWTGLIYIAIGAALGALGHRLGSKTLSAEDTS